MESSNIVPSTTASEASILSSDRREEINIREVDNGFVVSTYNSYPGKTFIFATLEEALVKVNDIFIEASK